MAIKDQNRTRKVYSFFMVRPAKTPPTIVAIADPGLPPVTTYELTILAEVAVVDTNTYTRVGGRQLDLSAYPTMIGTLNRVVTFVVDMDCTAGATSVDAKLYDLTHTVDVSGTSLTHNTSTNTEVSSAALTLGSSAGDIRTDVAAQYEVYVKMVGGMLGVDSGVCTNARLVISYV